MRRWIVWLPLGVLGALAALFVGFGLRHDPHVNPAALVGRRLPAISLPALDGEPAQPLGAVLSGQAGAGAPVLLNVFASWCAPCAEEAPLMAALQRRGMRMVGVAYKDEPSDEHPSADTRGFLAKYGDPFTRVLVDADGRAGIELGVSGVPETFLVGADGRVLAKHSGPLTAPDARDFLRRIVGQEPRP